MTIVLARPAFWTEPRDPWAWQRALRRVAALGRVADPRPAWEGSLRGVLPRRAVPGLYGLKATPSPGTWLGVGLLVSEDQGWSVHPDARPLLDASRDRFQLDLARWLVERAPWVRLALTRLGSRAWMLPPGADPLQAAHRLPVGAELDPMAAGLRVTLDPSCSGVGQPLRVEVDCAALGPLRAPLYLLRALDWLDAEGRPTLPTDLGAGLLAERPAALLRRVSAEEADARGFVAVDRAARRLWAALHEDEGPADLGAWTDTVFGSAIARGTIEVHDWAPGQPRHGRGLQGDRDRKLVRWTIHNDFELPGGPR